MTRSRQMTRIELLEAVRRMPEKTPITSALFPRSDGKRTWVGWLTNYAKGDDSSLRDQRDARFIYNNWWNAPKLIWLAVSDPWRATSSLRANLSFRKRQCANSAASSIYRQGSILNHIRSVDRAAKKFGRDLIPDAHGQHGRNLIRFG